MTGFKYLLRSAGTDEQHQNTIEITTKPSGQLAKFLEVAESPAVVAPATDHPDPKRKYVSGLWFLVSDLGKKRPEHLF